MPAKPTTKTVASIAPQPTGLDATDATIDGIIRAAFDYAKRVFEQAKERFAADFAYNPIAAFDASTEAMIMAQACYEVWSAAMKRYESAADSREGARTLMAYADDELGRFISRQPWESNSTSQITNLIAINRASASARQLIQIRDIAGSFLAK